MKLNERQLELVQGAAEVLILELKLTHEEVLKIISSEIRKELMKQKITMEDLSHRERSQRATFIRHVVAGVQEYLIQRGGWSQMHIEKTIRKFMKILHQSWKKESLRD